VREVWRGASGGGTATTACAHEAKGKSHKKRVETCFIAEVDKLAGGRIVQLLRR
jgi:hypothetical protein